jgi:hypothetical protein
MDGGQIDTLARALTMAGSRRMLLGATLAYVLGRVGRTEGIAQARAKRQPRRRMRRRHEPEQIVANRHKKKKRKKRGATSPPALSSPTSPQSPPVPPPPPPPPGPPPPTGPGFCAWNGTSDGIQSSGGLAETFLPPRAGPLTKAEIGLRFNAPNFSLTFTVRTVDETGMPTNVVLATATVTDIPATDFVPGVFRTVSATFGAPAMLVLGQRYALTVTGPHDSQYGLHANTGAEVCPDGRLFFDSQSPSFFEWDGADMVFALTIG